jgi:hypothetical protein
MQTGCAKLKFGATSLLAVQVELVLSFLVSGDETGPPSRIQVDVVYIMPCNRSDNLHLARLPSPRLLQ